MYQITFGDNKVYADKLTYIRLNKRNGSYVLCDEEEAEGICVKVPKECGDEDNVAFTAEDTVFALKEGGLNGTEDVCEIGQAQVSMDFFKAKQAEELLAMIEEVL